MCIIGAITISMLSGCGKENTVDKEAASAVAEEKIAEPEAAVVEEEPEEAKVEEEVISENEVVVAEPVTQEFDWGLVTTSYPYEDAAMSHNIVQYTNEDGKVMNFTFDSVENLMTGQKIVDNNLYLASNQLSFLYVWYGGELPDETFYLKNLSKDVLFSLIPNGTHPDDGYYEEELNDTYHKIIFAVDRKDGGVETKGYACYIDNYDFAECYQFAYFESAENYDDAKALAIVNSISVVR